MLAKSYKAPPGNRPTKTRPAEAGKDNMTKAENTESLLVNMLQLHTFVLGVVYFGAQICRGYLFLSPDVRSQFHCLFLLLLRRLALE